MKYLIIVCCLLLSINVFSSDLKYPKLNVKNLGQAPDAKTTDEIESVYQAIYSWNIRFTNLYIKEFLALNNIKRDHFNRDTILKDFKIFITKLSEAEVRQLLVNDASGKMLLHLDRYARALYSKPNFDTSNDADKERLHSLEKKLDSVNQKMTTISDIQTTQGGNRKLEHYKHLDFFHVINFLFTLFLMFKIRKLKVLRAH